MENLGDLSWYFPKVAEFCQWLEHTQVVNYYGVKTRVRILFPALFFILVGIAQGEEHNLVKVGVASSNLASHISFITETFRLNLSFITETFGANLSLIALKLNLRSK